MTLKEFRKQYPACFTFLRDEIIEQLIENDPIQLEEDLCSAFNWMDDYIDDCDCFIKSKCRKLPKS